MEENIFSTHDNTNEESANGQIKLEGLWEIGNGAEPEEAPVVEVEQENKVETPLCSQCEVETVEEQPAQEIVADDEAVVENLESQDQEQQEEPQVEAEQPAQPQEADKPQADDQPVAVAISSEDADKLVGAIDGHFNALRNLLKYNKDKDANVTKLTKELETYRDGIEESLIKSLAMFLIGVREDWKKSIKQFKERGLTVEEAKKYLNYLIYDCEDLLQNLNIEVKGEEIFYNRKSIDNAVQKKAIPCQAQEFTLPEHPQLAEKTVEGITEYLSNVEEYIIGVLKDNSILDNVVKTHTENSALLDEGVYQVVLYPIVRAIVGLHIKAQQEVDESLATLNGENATRNYVECATKMVDEIATIIEQCSVSIEEFVSDVYDAKKHRMQKMIVTENPEENGKVANVYSACYMMDARVIYPQKVDIYKLKQ